MEKLINKIKKNHISCGMICTIVLIVALGFIDSAYSVIRIPAQLTSATMMAGVAISIVVAVKKS